MLYCVIEVVYAVPVDAKFNSFHSSDMLIRKFLFTFFNYLIFRKSSSAKAIMREVLTETHTSRFKFLDFGNSSLLCTYNSLQFW